MGSHGGPWEPDELQQEIRKILKAAALKLLIFGNNSILQKIKFLN